jgi:hypothetical protein
MDDESVEDAWQASPWSRLFLEAEGTKPERVRLYRRHLLMNEGETSSLVELLREWYRRIAMVSVYMTTNEVHPEVHSFHRIRLFRSSKPRVVEGLPLRAENRLPVLHPRGSAIWGHMRDTYDEGLVDSAFDAIYGGNFPLHPGVQRLRGYNGPPTNVMDVALHALSLAWEEGQDDVGWVNGVPDKVPSTLLNPYEPLRDILNHPLLVWDLALHLKTREEQSLGWAEIGLSFSEGQKA